MASNASLSVEEAPAPNRPGGVFDSKTFLSAARIVLCVSAMAGVAQAADDDNEQRGSSIRLEGISVTGQVIPDFTVTEGSNSYTTAAMSTATGLNLSPQETPQSASVVTRKRIEDQGLDSVIDIIDHTTGLHSRTMDDGRYSITSRGISVDTILYDGVPVSYDTRFNYGDNHVDSAILDRVEVVRGATGLMTGSGNPSAAINLIRKKPTRSFQGSVFGGLGSWNHWRVGTDVSGPLTEEGAVRGRVVAVHQDRESFQDRFREKRSTLYGILEADLTERTTLTLGSDVQHTDPEGAMSGGLPLFYSDGSRTDYSRSTSTAPDWGGAETRTLSAFARLEHRFANDWTTAATFTYIDNDLEHDVLWPTGYPDPDTNEGMVPGSIALIDGERTQYSFDLKAGGPYSLFGREHEAAFGWHQRRQDFSNPYYFPTSSTPPLTDFRDENWSYPRPEWSDTKGTDSAGTTEERASYAVTRLNVTDPLTVIAGLRLSDWETDQDSFGTEHAFSIDNELTPYGGVIYDVTPRLSGYASYTEIFSPQTDRGADGGYLDPVQGEAYEAGIKAAVFQDRLDVALSVFNIRQDNLGQQVPGETLPGGEQVYEPVDGTRTRGFEAEVTGEVVPDWHVALGYTHFSAEDPDGEAINTSSPRRQLKLFTAYRLPDDWYRWTVGGGLRWQSRQYQTAESPDGPVEVEQGSYAVFDLMGRYQATDRLSLAVNVKNVLDETYYTQVGMFDQYQYGAPRNVMATLRYNL